MTKRDMLEVLKTLLQALGDAETPKPAPPPTPPPPTPPLAQRPVSQTGWVMDAFGCPMPEHPEAVEFSQPTLAMDLVDVASYIKRAAPPTPQDRDVDITRAASREATRHIDILDSRTWRS